MSHDKKYVSALESVIKQTLKPLRGVPFNLVIESMSGYRVLPFDKAKMAGLLGLLEKATIKAGKEINKKGIKLRRANEVGTAIEPFIQKSLTKIGLSANTPKTVKGKHKTMGYPDLEFKFGKQSHYLECKTFNTDNVGTTQRSFYFSPSDDLKIAHDACHFVVSLEMYVSRRSGAMNIYKCSGWKILSIDKLLVDLKYEFQSDNKRLYSGAHTLREGDF